MRHSQREGISIEYLEGRTSPRLTLPPRGEAMGNQAGLSFSSLGMGGFGHAKEFVREYPPAIRGSTRTTSAIQPFTIGNKRRSAAALPAVLGCGGHPGPRHHQASLYY